MKLPQAVTQPEPTPAARTSAASDLLGLGKSLNSLKANSCRASCQKFYNSFRFAMHSFSFFRNPTIFAFLHFFLGLKIIEAKIYPTHGSSVAEHLVCPVAWPRR